MGSPALREMASQCRATMADGLSILNPFPKRLSGPELLHQLVGIASEPDAVAIEYASEDGNCERLSYGELDRRSDGLACHMLQAKATLNPGDQFILPCFIPQSLDLYIAQIATLKAGGAFCPIVLDVPEDRLRFILKDVNASVLLTVSELRPRLPDIDGVNIIEVDQALIGNIDSSATFAKDIQPCQAAYVM
jgi:ferricrocin synthase